VAALTPARSRLALAFAAALALPSTLAPARAEASQRTRVPAPAPASRPKSPVAWSTVAAPAGDDKARLEKMLRALLEREAAQADWGRAARGGDLEATFALRRFEHTVDRGVLRVHCAAAGRLRDGRPARSAFTLGGRPEERAALDRRALTLAVRGVVVRLAELARSAARPRIKVANEPGEF
jgi:hypothetical protein